MKIIFLFTLSFIVWSSFAIDSISGDVTNSPQQSVNADSEQARFELLLKDLYVTDKSQYHFVLGEDYYFGEYRNRDVSMAVDNLLSSLKADDRNPKANYLLGTIYAVERNYFNKELAVKHLKRATDSGDVDALENLYHLYRRGWLVRSDIYPYLVAGKSSSESVALAYAQEQLGICSEDVSNVCMVKLSDFLLARQFKDRESDAMFLLAKIYSKADLAIFDAQKRDFYLSKSADLGNKDAIRILEGYKRHLGPAKSNN